MVEAFFDLVHEALVEGKDVKLVRLWQLPDSTQGHAQGATHAPVRRFQSMRAMW